MKIKVTLDSVLEKPCYGFTIYEYIVKTPKGTKHAVQSSYENISEENLNKMWLTERESFRKY